MATIKSYTDIEQSKKLAEILPLESADMSYSAITEGMRDKMIIKDWEVTIGLDPAIKNNLFSYRNGYVFPCWSLAALLETIPQEIFDGEYIVNITEGIGNKWVITYDHYENRNHSYYGLSTGADNPVDACYEMILKLNELNLL